MWLLDQWAERHIIDAQSKGEFDGLPGAGEPLVLDDDSHVPPELRAGFRLLKMQAVFLLSLSSAERQYSCLNYSQGSAKMILVIRR
ncbi:hypothetical protein SF123566_7229 [Shigella flexneri 1235-66]|nr:hypothetical protein SF123566_7229 [Shigella flexneri 1235-66]